MYERLRSGLKAVLLAVAMIAAALMLQNCGEQPTQQHKEGADQKNDNERNRKEDEDKREDDKKIREESSPRDEAQRPVRDGLPREQAHPVRRAAPRH